MELSDREYLKRLFEAFYEVGALPGGGVTRLGYTELRTRCTAASRIWPGSWAAG